MVNATSKMASARVHPPMNPTPFQRLVIIETDATMSPMTNALTAMLKTSFMSLPLVCEECL